MCVGGREWAESSVVCRPESQTPDFPKAHGGGLGVGALEVSGVLCRGWRFVSSPGLLIVLSGFQPLSDLHCLDLCYREARVAVEMAFLGHTCFGFAPHTHICFTPSLSVPIVLSSSWQRWARQGVFC